MTLTRLLTLLLAVTFSSTVLTGTLLTGTLLAETYEREAAELRIVVRAENPATVMTVRELSKMFLKKSTRWDDGTPVVPVDQVAEAEIRKLFSRTVHGRSSPGIQNYWQRQIFSGQGMPPDRVSSDEAVLDYVSRNPGAIGYVDAGTPLINGVRSLKLADLVTAADLGPMAPGNASLTSATYPSHPSGTQVITERGDIRILATGSCGQAGSGRKVLLQNRNAYETIRVTTEVARWTRDRFNSSSRDRHTLAGHEEKRLGCTRLSDDVELRYSIVRVSDNSVESYPRRDHHAPRRDFIALVESGTCGQKGEGKRISAVNRHRDQSIQVFIERVRKLNGAFKNRSMTSYRLQAGGQQELGCNRQGNLTQEFYVVQTN